MRRRAFLRTLAGLAEEQTTRLTTSDHLLCQVNGETVLRRVSPSLAIPTPAALVGSPQSEDSYVIQDASESGNRLVPAASILNRELLSALSGAPQAADSFLIQDGAETVPRLVPAASILNPNLLASETVGLASTEHLLVQVNGESVPRVMDASLLPTGATTKQDLPCYTYFNSSDGGSSISTSYATELTAALSVPRSGVYLFGATASAIGSVDANTTASGACYVWARFQCPDGSYSPEFPVQLSINQSHLHTGDSGGYTSYSGVGVANAGAVSFVKPVSLTAGTRYGYIQMKKTGTWSSGSPLTEGLSIWLAEIG
jgi:hypothetical protein